MPGRGLIKFFDRPGRRRSHRGVLLLVRQTLGRGFFDEILPIWAVLHLPSAISVCPDERCGGSHRTEDDTCLLRARQRPLQDYLAIMSISSAQHQPVVASQAVLP